MWSEKQLSIHIRNIIFEDLNKKGGYIVKIDIKYKNPYEAVIKEIRRLFSGPMSGTVLST